MKWPFHRNTARKQKMFLAKKPEKKFVRGRRKESHNPDRQEAPGGNIWVWSTVSLWCLFIGVSGYQIFLSGALSVDQIIVEGAESLSSEEVRGVVQEDLFGWSVGIFPRNNMLLLSKKGIEESIRVASPLIRHVEVERLFPNALKITLLERGDLFFWCSREHSCQMLDEEGVVLDYPQAIEEHRVAQFFLVDESGEQAHVGDQVMSRATLDFVRSLPQALSEQADIRMKENISLPSRYADELRIETENGFDIRMNVDIPIEKTLNVLHIVREKAVPRAQREKISSIDLRVPGKAFYQIRDDERQEADISPDISTEPKQNK